MVEIWRSGGSESTTSIAEARAVEKAGWDGQMFMDSQLLSADPYAIMGVWAVATDRLKLCTGVTNPFTRHPAVTAAAAATIQSISGGRAVLGIGRGDSALAYLGHAPFGVAGFERTLRDLQTLLSGGEITFGERKAAGDAPSLETMSLGDRPTSMGLRWLPEGLPKVPLDVAATGPKVIAMSAVIAEQVTFSVGANVERMQWAIDLARKARAEQGLPADGVSFGAQIIVYCHPDLETATEVASVSCAPLARFQVIQGQAAGPQSESDTRNFEAIRTGYDMTKHSKLVAAKIIGATLEPDFVRRFAIVGPPDHCVQRLLDLIRCGLDRVVVVGTGNTPESWGENRHLFVREVLPELKAELGVHNPAA